MSDMTRAASVRRNLAVAALGVGAVGTIIAGLLQIDTGKSGVEELTKVAAHPNRFFAGSLLFGLSIGLVAAGIGQVYRLIDRKGAVWATVGGIAMQVGGMLAGAGILMYSGAVYVASKPGLDRAAMAKWDVAANHSAATGWLFTGFFAFVLGGVVLGIGLLRARTVPIWQPILLMVGVVLVMVLQPDNSLLGTLVGLPLVVGLISLAWSVSRLPAAATPTVDLTEREVPFPRTAAETAPAEQPSTN